MQCKAKLKQTMDQNTLDPLSMAILVIGSGFSQINSKTIDFPFRS
jgi:hypothetical protein